MPEEPSDQLTPWIVAPLLFVVVLLFATFTLSISECGEDTSKEGVAAFIIVAGVAVLIAGAGLLRLAAMARRRQFGKRDGWIFAGLLIGGAAGVLVRGWDFLPLGFFALTIFSLVVLAAAAMAGRGVKAVGVLLPIYLFGIAFLCMMVGLFILAANQGAFC